MTLRPLVFAVADTGCFEVESHRVTEKGYIRLRIDGGPVRAHRLIWEQCFGPIPSGLFVCHRCDNPKCINPEHLFLGSNTDNTRDKTSKGRQARGAGTGHAKLTERDVREVLRRYKPRDRVNGVRAMAIEFGVSNTCIQFIVSRKTWKWMPEAK